MDVSFGRTLRDGVDTMVLLLEAAWLFATSWRRVERLVKYNAEPKPVRSAEGTVPRHSEVIGCGPARIERRTGRSEVLPACCTRVLRRSAGCRRTAEETPLARPATKWNVGWAFLIGLAGVVLPFDIAVKNVYCSAGVQGEARTGGELGAEVALWHGESRQGSRITGMAVKVPRETRMRTRVMRTTKDG